MARTSEPLVITIPEAGKRLRMSAQSAYAAARKGQIPTIRIGHLIRVPVARFERMLAGEK